MSFIHFYAFSLFDPRLSVTQFISSVSEVEGELQTIRALNFCGIGLECITERSHRVYQIAEAIGYATELGLICETLFDRYLTDLILFGNQVDAVAWNEGFRSGVSEAESIMH